MPIIQSTATPTKRIEFSARKSCIEKVTAGSIAAHLFPAVGWAPCPSSVEMQSLESNASLNPHEIDSVNQYGEGGTGVADGQVVCRTVCALPAGDQLGGVRAKAVSAGIHCGGRNSGNRHLAAIARTTNRRSALPRCRGGHRRTGRNCALD